MTHHTLAEIAAKFARLDDIDDEQHSQFEKGLRNLVQRHFLPPTTQQGRIFLYDAAAAVTIRLAQIASEFGLSRASVDTLSRWLSTSGTRKEPQGLGWRGVSHAEEAIQRVEQGEEFSVALVMRADRTIGVRADWKRDEETNENSTARAEIALALLHGHDIASFSLPVSLLVKEILPALKG